MGAMAARIGVVLALVSAAVVGPQTIAHALPDPLPIYCNTVAIFNITPGTGAGVQTWSVTMQGTCDGDFQGAYSAVGSASGTSVGAGFCGGLVTTNLALTATLHLYSARGPGFDKTLIETWSAPVTTYPIATPFLINGTILPTGHSTLGGGTMNSRLLGPLSCPPHGQPSGQIISIRTT